MKPIDEFGLLIGIDYWYWVCFDGLIYIDWMMDLWVGFTLFSPRGQAYVFVWCILYIWGCSFNITRLIYLFYAFFVNILFSFSMVGIEGDGGRWRFLVTKGTWVGLPNIPLRSWRHKEWGFEHKDSHYREPMWFSRNFLCFSDIALWALVKGIFMPQSWKLTNSSSRSCMMFMKLNYIDSCNYFNVLHSRGGINMWILTDGR